jgi:hypothetical protein
MIFRRIHTDQSAWYCVFRSDETGEHVLYAALREPGWPEAAIRLTSEEIQMFLYHPEEFGRFARAFIATHDMPTFEPRKLVFRSRDADHIEVQ